MKKYSEILAEIKAARAAMTDTAKTEKEIERAAFMEISRNGSDAEKEKARAAFKKACDKLTDEQNRNNDIKMKIEILKENAKRALFAENIKAVCDIWNKYEGKPHGEKTAQKIRDEIKNTTGNYAYICNKYEEASITIRPGCTPYAYNDEITICPIWNGEKKPALINNKIIKIDPENMRLCYCGEYVENIDDHINKLKAAHAGALKALEEYRAAIDKYNELTRGNMTNANDREGVKHYII